MRAVFDKCINGFGNNMRGFHMCENQKEYVFWDFAHPTTKAYCWVSYWLHLQMYKDEIVAVPPSLQFYEKMCRDVPVWAGVVSDAQAFRGGEYLEQQAQEAAMKAELHAVASAKARESAKKALHA